jgi:hypothetical protein
MSCPKIEHTHYGFRLILPKAEVIITKIVGNTPVEVGPEPKLENLECLRVLLAAAWDPDEKVWDADTCAGLQRWHGPMKTSQISAGMRKLGFPPHVISATLRKAKQKQGRSVPYIQ